MALVLIKEDGSGLAGANSYASAADGDAYHLGHSYASAWTGATTAQKEAALVMATRLIDAYMEFGGEKNVSGQALQWPRYGCVDMDRGGGGTGVLSGWVVRLGCFSSAAVPACVVAATCEMARELLSDDRTAEWAGQGLLSSGVGAVKQVFDRLGKPTVLSRVTMALLRKVGYAVEGGCAVRLVRA